MAEDSAQSETIARLKAAVEAYGTGEGPVAPLIDEREEEILAPVKARARRLVDHRDRSAHELRTRLIDAGFDDRAVSAVVDACVANGMVDDARFAREWVRQRHRNQHRSAAVLRRELRDKGVDDGVIEDALAQVTADDEREAVRLLVGRRAASVKRVPRDRTAYDRELRRVVGVAARRGFPEGLSLAMAREALDARIAELGGEGRGGTV
ncbi:regulatory protein RecX [Corynebacterium bovis]|uniref:Regulatory protein RecX n=1 Tax=Corynebacterium bovis DSM 20582 = CIP 54.80 TaxID=927655 RepID=A0A8I0CQ37_9CORY|nr:regulatory protein RecX [Corynebacterium bovis]MBB3116566.1 regulatory protein [Corynebacterium bovis DSM 20582 = CIP 54.80]QQC47681.1 regulatory protein RecX [Corynebacterium bovis]RRO82559.1 recombination regulator RecX [Corynebacterium bovis]RRO83133.1 recombination regulator RecX [Corynebacterium bovis]RRO84670.1 recombination regulator RecX [Corynebacterium bovis]